MSARDITVACDLYAVYSNDDSSIEKGSTYIRTSQTSGDKNVYFTLPVPLQNPDLDSGDYQLEIVSITIKRENGETWWNKYLYRSNDGTATQVDWDNTAYTDDHTWTVNAEVNTTDRLFVRLITTAANNSCEKLYGVSVTYRQVPTRPSYQEASLTGGSAKTLVTTYNTGATMGFDVESPSDERLLVLASVKVDADSGGYNKLEWEVQEDTVTKATCPPLEWTTDGGQYVASHAFILDPGTGRRTIDIQHKKAGTGSNTVTAESWLTVISLSS